MTALTPHAARPLIPPRRQVPDRHRTGALAWGQARSAPGTRTTAGRLPDVEALLAAAPDPVTGAPEQRFRLVDPDAVPRGAVVLAVLVLAPGVATGDQVSTGPRAVPDHRPGPGLVVDELSRLAHLNGEELDLTRREFDLLLHLARHPGRVHSREQLLQTVWELDDPRFASPRTVDVHVARLRRKLGPEQGDRLETLRGIGYRWSRRDPTVDEG
jgi:DNA-binding winged helix-turn-helix (wHTH) protein